MAPSPPTLPGVQAAASPRPRRSRASDSGSGDGTLDLLQRALQLTSRSNISGQGKACLWPGPSMTASISPEARVWSALAPCWDAFQHSQRCPSASTLRVASAACSTAVRLCVQAWAHPASDLCTSTRRVPQRSWARRACTPCVPWGPTPPRACTTRQAALRQVRKDASPLPHLPHCPIPCIEASRRQMRCFACRLGSPSSALLVGAGAHTCMHAILV